MVSRFDRRRVLQMSALGLAAFVRARWASGALAGEGLGLHQGGARAAASRADALSVAWSEAVGRGKPMLVFLVPRHGDDNQCGTRLAYYLGSAAPEAHADLALCEVVCATSDGVRALLPTLALPSKWDPAAILVEPDGRSARTALEWMPRVVERRDVSRGPGRLASAAQRAEWDEVNARSQRWSEPIAQELRAAIVKDREALDRRAEQARSRLAPADRERLERRIAEGGSWSQEDVARCPAWALSSAANEDDRRRCVAELASLSRTANFDHAPRGARWATHGGCGDVRLEDPPESIPGSGPCGTGFLPEQSRRFLWLYSNSGR